MAPPPLASEQALDFFPPSYPLLQVEEPEEAPVLPHRLGAFEEAMASAARLADQSPVSAMEADRLDRERGPEPEDQRLLDAIPEAPLEP